jgi:hypothetical protein
MGLGGRDAEIGDDEQDQQVQLLHALFLSCASCRVAARELIRALASPEKIGGRTGPGTMPQSYAGSIPKEAARSRNGMTRISVHWQKPEMVA